MKPYFSHDEGARNDPKLVEVLMTLGHEGKSVYWDLVEMLYEQGGYLMLSQCKGYAWQIRIEQPVLESLINNFGLFENDGTKFWSETILRRMTLRQGKSVARAEAGSKGGRVRAQREAAAKEKGTHTKTEWAELLAFCDNQCACCGSTDAIQKDHIKPIYQGGSDAIENLQPLCKQCNTSKGPNGTDHRLRFFQAKPKQVPSKLQAMLEQNQAIKEKEIKGKEIVGKPTNADSAAPSSAAVDLKAIKEKEKELDFISFWLPYYGDLPKRGSKADAKKQWLALSAATRALILTGLEAHRAEATRNGPDYLPYATTFLGQQRWKWDTFGTVSPTNALPSQPTTSAQFPMPGHELPGQVFYIAGRPGDYNMDKMAAESCLKHFPSSKVVSLAFPQVPYTMKDGNVIRG